MDQILPLTFVKYAKLLEQENQLVLNEGLITSYPFNTFKESLFKKFSTIIYDYHIIKTFNDIPVKIVLHLKNKNAIEDIKKFLDLTGYHIGVSLDKDKTLQIEPKYPQKVLVSELPEKLYHITRKKNINSITKIGLTPRESKTFFQHPGNKIYLFATKNLNAILSLKQLLFTTFKAREKDEFSINDLVVLEVTPDPFTHYFLDYNLEVGDVTEGSFGVFTLKNVKPQDIKVVDI